MVGCPGVGNGGSRLSAARKQGRFGYLSQQETPPVTPDADEAAEEIEEAGEPELGSGGGEGVSPPAPELFAGPVISTQTFSSVPKGHGRMKQKRSQLNVRIPTSLKRQASAKAVLEGKDIGEVVEGLLRDYLDK